MKLTKMYRHKEAKFGFRFTFEPNKAYGTYGNCPIHVKYELQELILVNSFNKDRNIYYTPVPKGYTGITFETN